MTEFPVTRATLLFAVQTPENREAWEEFVVTYRPVIYRMARRRGMQDADAQDVTQNILVSVSEAIKHYDQQPGTRFRHWLRRVAKIGRRTRDSDWSVVAICCHLKWVAGVGLSLRRNPRGVTRASLQPRPPSPTSQLFATTPSD